MQTKTKLFILILFLFSIKSAYSQLIMDRNLLSEVNQSVISKHGQSVKVQFIYQLDSLNVSVSNYPSHYTIIDIKGTTLAHATVFTGFKFENGNPAKGIVGVYKNGNIIWDSDTTINCQDIDGLTVFSIADINRDGKIDLIFAADKFTQSSTGLERLYIYSWDGTSGQLITELDSQGISTIVSLTGIGDFDFVDVNGDGIYEITGLWYFSQDDLDEKQVTYYWNGINYSFNLSLPQPQEYDFLTQNKIDITLNAKVSKSDSGFIYKYWVHNLPTSKQEIYLIDFQLKIDSLNAKFPPEGWNSTEFFDLTGFEDLEYPTTNLHNHFIRIDSSDYCGFRSFYLPSIINSYFQGYNRTPYYSDSTLTWDDFYKDILLNSRKEYTIGPSNIFDTLSIQGILDTLIHYNNQSFELGWLTNQSTADKYSSYFTTAKTQLQQNNITGVKSTLQNILQNVDQDSSANLTSEAYALLRYNTEYLLGNLLRLR